MTYSTEEERVAMQCSSRGCQGEGNRDFRKVALCEECWWEIHIDFTNERGKVISSLSSDQLLKSESEGVTYILQVDEGNFKIGYTGLVTDSKVWERIRNVNSEMKREGFSGVISIAALLDGGYTMERRLHFLLREYRVIGPFERFVPNEALSALISSGSLHPIIGLVRDRFDAYNRKKKEDEWL